MTATGSGHGSKQAAVLLVSRFGVDRFRHFAHRFVTASGLKYFGLFAALSKQKDMTASKLLISEAYDML
jgi:hypothetical protein